MLDNFGRKVEYMRISVTDRCNLRCRYCMPDEGVADLGHDAIIGFAEIERVVRAAASLGFRKFRLTGGEPLVRKDFADLVKNLSAIEGVEELAMTTNGTLLADYAVALKKAGMRRVNISLDTLRPERFAEITRGGKLEDVFKGIAAAESAGLAPIRLNAVAMRGFNDDEIMDFARITLERPYDVRFIELMPIGNTGNPEDYYSAAQIEEEIRAQGFEPVEEGTGVAKYLRRPGAPGRIGLITPISCHFCERCNKIRLTSDGKIKPCLHSDREVDLKSVLNSGDDETLKNALADAVRSKEERHHIGEGVEPIRRGMNKIGG